MNTPATQAEQCSYLNLKATDKGLSEYSSRGGRAVFIPRNEIESIRIMFGSYSERPILQPIMALCLLAVGAVGVDWLASESGRGIRLGVGLLAFGAIGAYCMYEAVKKGHFLAVSCKGGMRKLIPRGKVNEADFARFASCASSLGYRLSDK